MAVLGADAAKSRQKITYESARIMAQEGVRDFQRAKEKACVRLGVKSTRNLPTNAEVEQELELQLQLFCKERTQKLQHEYVVTALQIMEQISAFSPMLVGAALSGNITLSRPVEIHVFPEVEDAVCEALDELGLNYQLVDKRIALPKGQYAFVPTAKFMKRDIEVDVVIISNKKLMTTLSPVDRKVVKRASLKKVRRMVKKLNSA